MSNDRISELLYILANHIAGKQISAIEKIRLEIQVKSADVPTRQTICKAAAYVLDCSDQYVAQKLSAHDDSDRLIDELINMTALL